MKSPKLSPESLTASAPPVETTLVSTAGGASVSCEECDGTGELQPSLSCCGGQGCGACTADPNGYSLLRCGACGGDGVSRTKHACRACGYVGNLDEFGRLCGECEQPS